MIPTTLIDTFALSYPSRRFQGAWMEIKVHSIQSVAIIGVVLGLVLRIERVIDAPAGVVFEAFTTDGGQEAFYGQDDPGWIVESDCDLRVGGVCTVTFGPARSHLYRHRHVFEVIDRPRRIVLATTESRPDGSSFDFAIEFTFEERDGRTFMTVTQSGFPTAELRDEHGRGVPNAFARFERVIRAMR